jgi:energy-coupling factor transport system substrate-specific component
VIGAAGGLILIPIFIVFQTPMVLAAPLAYAAVVGAWFLPGAIAQGLLRRGGAAALTMLIAGLVCVPFTPYGFSAVASTLMVGLLQEVPFVFTLWRYWAKWLVYLWAVIVGVCYAVFLWYGTQAPADLGYVEQGSVEDTAAGGLSVEVLWIMIPIVVASAVLFTFIGHTIANAIARTGVARGLQPPANRLKKTAPPVAAE